MKRALLFLALIITLAHADYFQGFTLHVQDALNEHFETDEISFRKIELPAFHKERWSASYKEAGWIEEYLFECHKKTDYIEQLSKSRDVLGTIITFQDEVAGGNPGEKRYRTEFKCGNYQFYTYTDFVNYSEFVSLMEAAVGGCETALKNEFAHPLMESEPEASTPTPSVAPTPSPQLTPTVKPSASPTPTPSPSPSSSPTPNDANLSTITPSPAPAQEEDYSGILFTWVFVLLLGFSAVIYLGRK